ncbi:hypothetical protein FACS189464_1720 [Bacteroidia bacterium]|nr:hypothetical protein FACS189464_1720 [Bacteroidia bacterium]
MNLISQNELLGLGALPQGAPAKKEARKALRAKANRLSTTSASGKAFFEKLMNVLPADIQQAIRNARLQLVDEIIYAVKDMNGYQERYLFESADNKTPGITNLDRQKIEANKWTLLKGIQLLSADANGKQALALPIVLNGEFELEVGSTVIVPNVSCSVFDTYGRTDIRSGYWDGFDPQFITPNTEIKPKLILAAQAAAALPVYIALHCVSVAKN